MTELRIFSVTLAFTPPGPLHTSLVIAQDEANASAMAMQHAMGNLPIVTPLATVLAVAVDPDVLRQMLRAIEGRGPGEVVSLVRPEQRAAEILRKHEPDLDAADASTFCGSGVTEAWESYKAAHPDIYGPKSNRQPPLRYWGEEYGPPMPEAS